VRYAWLPVFLLPRQVAAHRLSKFDEWQLKHAGKVR
jgi:hypothetical protein